MRYSIYILLCACACPLWFGAARGKAQAQTGAKPLGIGESFLIEIDDFRGSGFSTEPKFDRNDGLEGDNPFFQRRNVSRARQEGPNCRYWHTTGQQEFGEPDPEGEQWVDYRPPFIELGVGEYRVEALVREGADQARYPVEYQFHGEGEAPVEERRQFINEPGGCLWLDLGEHAFDAGGFVRVRDSGAASVSFGAMRFTKTKDAAKVRQGLRLEKEGTEDVYFTYDGEPLLSFGGLSDFLFYAGRDAYDYRLWADWAGEHGMNHVRAYPPLSWMHVEKFIRENNGDLTNALFPYQETAPGSRQFDLTRFNPDYWDRMRRQLEYLEQRGIIVHLLMWNGWQLRASDSGGQDRSEVDWSGHFFNPANNVNAFTDFLGGALENRFRIYESVADEREALAEAQRRWFEKIAETCAPFGNVYFDLVHELAEHQGDWSKTQAWIEAMALASRERWETLQSPENERSFLIGMDTGGLGEDERGWIFSRPWFDLLIYGKAHQPDNVIEWRRRYGKPYIPQEAWDEDGTKYSSMHPEQRVHARKYFWKFMMLRGQQLDLYMKQRQGGDFRNLPELPHNYDPSGRNPLEEDARLLRAFWDSSEAFPELRIAGRIEPAIYGRRMVLSSPEEAWIYLSSDTGEENMEFKSESIMTYDLLLEDGVYELTIFKPDQGEIGKGEVEILNGHSHLEVPRFTDDLMIRLHRKDANGI